MRVFAASIILLLLSRHALASDAAQVPRLSVTPLLCIIDKRSPTCEATFLVHWESERTGYFCLFNDFSDAPVRCWTDENRGNVKDMREVTETFSYWITDEDTTRRLVSVAVEVLRLDNGDRRRRRRGRHVWDLL